MHRLLPLLSPLLYAVSVPMWGWTIAHCWALLAFSFWPDHPPLSIGGAIAIRFLAGLLIPQGQMRVGLCTVQLHMKLAPEYDTKTAALFRAASFAVLVPLMMVAWAHMLRWFL